MITLKHRFAAQFLCVAASAGVFACLLAGCGGSEVDGFVPVASPLPSATPGASAFAGTYRSAGIALPEGRTGNATVTVGADNRCTGTLVVAGGSATRQAAAFSFAAGTYAISGTVDPATGAFTMTGNIGGQPFTYGGTLPTPGNGNVGGSYSLTAGGQTYTGSFAGGTTPTPNPTPTPVPSSGGAVTFAVVSKSADCNLTESKLANLSVKSATVSANTGGTYAFGSALTSGDSNFSLGWLRLNDPDGFTPETQVIPTNPQAGAFGDNFQVALNTIISSPAGVGLSFGGQTLPGAGVWRPKSGTIVIESITGSTVVVRGENVVFEPVPAPTNSGTGTFTTNFRITYSNVTGL